MLFQSLISYLYPIICNLITITCYFKRNFVNENKLQKYNFLRFPIFSHRSLPLNSKTVNWTVRTTFLRNRDQDPSSIIGGNVRLAAPSSWTPRRHSLSHSQACPKSGNSTEFGPSSCRTCRPEASSLDPSSINCLFKWSIVAKRC